MPDDCALVGGMISGLRYASGSVLQTIQDLLEDEVFSVRWAATMVLGICAYE